MCKDWPHLSPRVVALGLTLGKCCGGSALPRSLAFAVQCQEVADVLAEVPESIDRGFAREMNFLGARGN